MKPLPTVNRRDMPAESWPCACVRRNAQGVITHLKMHGPSQKRCRTCGLTRDGVLKLLDDRRIA